MEVKIVKGENFKNFIQIEKLESLAELKDLKKIVSRSEYKFYLKRKVSATCLYDDTFIPIQFLRDIEEKFIKHPFKITNPEAFSEIYNTNLKRSVFNKLLSNIVLPPKFNINVDKYIYQPDSVFNALVVKTGRVKIGTGGGKTLITYLYCKFLLLYLRGDRKARKILIVVPKVDLVKQTVKAFKEFNEFNEPLIVESLYGGSKRTENAEVIVGTYQTLCNFDSEYFDDFFCFICDEAHTAKAYSIRQEIYNKCNNAEYIFAMSATYHDYKTIDYLNTVAMFGPVVKEKTLRQLIDDGNICDIIINRITINYKTNKEIQQLHNKIKAENELLEPEDKLTGAEIYRTVRAEVQQIDERNEIIKNLTSLDNNHLILVESVDYLQTLYSKLYLEFQDKIVIVIHGKVKNREELFELMERECNVICIATYDTFSTGISVNNLHYVHFPDGGKSFFRVFQGVGRGVRLHKLKKFLQVFDYVDKISNSSYVKHSSERLKMYKSEKLTIKEKEIFI